MFPRALDLVWDLLDLMKYAQDHGIEGEPAHLVLDFSDAFFQIPLAFDDRKIAAVRHRGRLIWFQRAPQGPRGSPLPWARTCSLICRLALALNGPKLNQIN